MRPAAVLLAALLAAALGALGGVGAVLVGQELFRPVARVEQQPMTIRFKQAIPGRTSAARLDRMAVRGRVRTEVPVRQAIEAPLRGRYLFRMDLDQAIPVRMTIRHMATLPIDTTAEIEASTNLLYGGAKQYRNVRFRAAIPLRFSVQVPLTIRVDTRARVRASGPMAVDVDHILRLPVADRLRTHLDLDADVKGALLGPMKVVLTPSPAPVGIVVTEAELR